MECFLNQFAAWLAAIIAEIAFYQWNLQENGIGYNYKTLIIIIGGTGKEANPVKTSSKQSNYYKNNYTISYW